MYVILGFVIVVVFGFIGFGLYEFYTEHRQDRDYHLDHFEKINKEPSK
jgi:hypothetical protein